MKQENGVVSTFRLNFRDALHADGRSLSRFARDIKASISYLSRIRSGSPHTENGQPIVPGLDMCERIALGLGHSVIDMLKPASEFRRLLRSKYPDFSPSVTKEARGRPAPEKPKSGPRKRRRKTSAA